MNIYETHVMKDPQLPFIFHKGTTLHPHSGFRPSNWHENVEIIYVTDGSGIITVDAQQLNVSAGDITVINTSCLHNFLTVQEHFTYHCLIVDRSFCLANHFDTNRIHFESLFRDSEIERLIMALAEEYEPDTSAPYRTQTIRASVLQIMALLCRRHSAVAEHTQSDSYLLACIKQAIGYIRSESHRNLTLDSVAGFVGLSKFYFAREFRRVTGYTLVAYVNLTRCEKAKTLLAENQLTVGEVGRTCGFENQSYFSRTFLAYTGTLPSAYRKERVKQNTL